MATERESVCALCIEAVTESARIAGEDYENPEFVHLLAIKFGARVSDHLCEEDEDYGVDCNCGCRVGILPWDDSFNTITTEGAVCESCIEAVSEAMMTVGERQDDLLYAYMMARTAGGDIFDHECSADDDESADCHCGCRRY